MKNTKTKKKAYQQKYTKFKTNTKNLKYKTLALGGT